MTYAAHAPSERGHINSTIACKEIELVVKGLPKKKTSDLYVFTGELYQTFKKEMILTTYKCLENIEERICPKVFCKANNTLLADKAFISKE